MNEKIKRKKHGNKGLTILDVILDKNNDDLIPLFDDKGNGKHLWFDRRYTRQK